MASNQQGPKYDLRGAQFAGGMAETVQGDQVGGIINNYGTKVEEVIRLLAALRQQAQSFPAEHKVEVLDTIDDLASDIQKPTPDSKKIGRRLSRLAAIAASVGLITGGVAEVSEDVKNFTENVIEIAEIVEVSID